MKPRKPEMPTLRDVLLYEATLPGSSYFDWNPFGGLLLDDQGNLKIVGGQFRAFVPQREWKSPEDFDKAILKMLTKAARLRPAGIITVSVANLPYTLACASACPEQPVRQLVGNQKTLDRAMATLKPEETKDWKFWPTPLVKGNLLLALPYPEMVGRTLGPNLSCMGACVFAPENIGGVCLKTT